MEQPSASGAPDISFVIINKDDRGLADTLAALEAVAAASELTSETVVVDASEGRLDDIRDRFGAVHWIPFVPTGGVSIAAQRNIGVRASTGAIVVFTDASCVPEGDWLATLLAPIRDQGEAIASGRVRSAGKPGIRDVFTDRAGAVEYVEEVATINLALRRDVFDRVGLFDERFAYGSDVDLSWRAGRAGYRIRYVPEAVVTHEFGSARSEAKRSFRYGAARARLYKKHLDRLPELPRRDPTLAIYPLFLLLLPLTLRVRLYPALIAIPLLKNARHRPVLTVFHHLVYAVGALNELVRGPRLSERA